MYASYLKYQSGGASDLLLTIPVPAASSRPTVVKPAVPEYTLIRKAMGWSKGEPVVVNDKYEALLEWGRRNNSFREDHTVYSGEIGEIVPHWDILYSIIVTNNNPFYQPSTSPVRLQFLDYSLTVPFGETFVGLPLQQIKNIKIVGGEEYTVSVSYRSFTREKRSCLELFREGVLIKTDLMEDGEWVVLDL